MLVQFVPFLAFAALCLAKAAEVPIVCPGTQPIVIKTRLVLNAPLPAKISYLNSCEMRALQHQRDTALSINPIEEADVERGPSGETDALLRKGSMDGDESIDASLESSGHLEDSDPDKARQRLVTTILINLSAIMERTDEQLLPAVYRFVGASFQVSLVTRAKYQHTGLLWTKL